MKNVCSLKCLIFSITFFRINNAVFKKDIALNIALPWLRPVDKGKVFGALLTDLSKAFDCLDHKLLTAKLNAYGFSLPTLRLINDYLSNRKQRTRIHSLDQRIVRKQLDIMPTYHYVQNQRKLMMQSRENDQKPQFGQFFDDFEVKYLQIAIFSEK